MKDIIINTQSSIKIGNIYFDPFRIKEEVHDAEIVFITHSHYDHFDIDSINNIKNDNTIFVVPRDEEIINSLDNDKLIIVDVDKDYEINGIKFSTVPSYNTNKSYHLKEYNWVGYVVSIDNEIYYIMGDTDDIGLDVKCDYLFIPIGGTYTMTYEEAANYTNRVKPKIVIPIHYGTIVGDKDYGFKFRDLIDDKIEVKLLLKF